MITQQDEQRHAATVHPLWRESYYFNFYDPIHHLGGVTTIAFHPNRAREERKEGLFYLYLPDGRVLVYLSTTPAEGEDPVRRLDGLEYEVLEPLQCWRIRANGIFQWVESGQQLQMAQLPAVSLGSEQVSLNLEFEAVSPIYDYPTSLQALREQRHYEQSGRIRGRVEIGGHLIAVDSLGFRDHSWGVRDWAVAEYYHQAMVQFADDFTLSVLLVGLGGVQVAAGFVHQADRNVNVETVQVQVQYDATGRVPQQAEMRVITENDEHLLLRASLIDWLDVCLAAREGKVVRAATALARFTCASDTGIGKDQERVGYGIWDYLRQDPVSC